jgi:hypothetical protein
MRSVLLLSAVVSRLACSSVALPDDLGGSGGDDGAVTSGAEAAIQAATGTAAVGGQAGSEGTGGSGGGGGGDGASQYPQGLFDCDFISACPDVSIYRHELDPGTACVAALAMSGAHGIVIERRYGFGPNPIVGEVFVEYLGDGTALVQERHKCLACERWTPTPATHVLHCEVDVPADIVAACRMGTDDCIAAPSMTLGDRCVAEPIPRCATPTVGTQ